MLPLSGWAQSELGLWTGVEVEKNLSRSFALEVKSQLRFAENISVVRTYLLTPGLTYKYNKHWKVSAYYRFMQRRSWEYELRDYRYTAYGRFYANLSYDRNLWKLKMDYRLRYQNQFKDDTEGSLASEKSYLRNRLGLSYKNNSRFTPFVSADLFYRINSHFDQIRYKAGTEYQINNHHSIDVSVFTDQELDTYKPYDFVIRLKYKLEF